MGRYDSFVKKLSSVVVVLALAVAAGCGVTHPAAVVIGTGPTNGVYYPYGQALAQILTKEIPGTEFSALATGASVDNLKMIQDGKLDLALTLADTLAEAHAGTGSFAETGKVDVYSIAILYTNYTHIVVRKGSGIAKVADLLGKTVATGAAGSGTEIVANRILSAAGVDPQTGITRLPLSLAAGATALKDGAIDALFWSGGIPTPGIQELASSLEVEMLPHGNLQPVLQGKYGPHLYRVHDLLTGAYPGVTTDISVVGVPNILVASARLTPEFVQEITRILFGANETLAIVLPEVRALAWPAHANVTPIPFHAGAIRYYEEHVWK